MTISLYGTPDNHWLHSEAGGFDLSRGATKKLNLETQKGQLFYDPSRSALVIVDFQNFFLHKSVRDHPKALAAAEKIAAIIPSVRAAGIKIIWLNWGLTQEEVDVMPPTHRVSFGATLPTKTGFGSEMGVVEDGGKEVNAGKLLFRDQWNTELYGELQSTYQEGEKNGTDVWIHKNRMSGAWGPSTMLEEYLIKENITTLFMSGCNTDQCVWGSLIDLHNKGYDTTLLTDGSGTNSPPEAQITTEFNAALIGFVATTKQFAQGI